MLFSVYYYYAAVYDCTTVYNCIANVAAAAAVMLRCDTFCLHHQSTDDRLSLSGVKLMSFIRSTEVR